MVQEYKKVVPYSGDTAGVLTGFFMSISFAFVFFICGVFGTPITALISVILGMTSGGLCVISALLIFLIMDSRKVTYVKVKK